MRRMMRRLSATGRGMLEESLAAGSPVAQTGPQGFEHNDHGAAGRIVVQQAPQMVQGGGGGGGGPPSTFDPGE